MLVKVCHISTAHKSNDTRVFNKECCSLAQAGFDVHLVIQSKDEVINGVQLHGLRTPDNRVDRMTGLVEEAYVKALEIDAAVYHIHDPELLPIAMRLHRRGKRVIFDSHEFYKYQIAKKDYLPKPIMVSAAWLYNIYETHICKQLDAVVVPCTRLGVNPFEGRAKRVVYVDNFPILPDPLQEPDYDRPKRDAVCYVGRLAHARGVTHLVQAGYRANVRVILAGPSDELYLEQLRRLPEYECVDYRGVLDKRGVAEVIRESFCGASALLNVGQYWFGDNLPTKAYEYMLYGTPVIMSPTPYAKRLFEEWPCGLLVNPEDIDAYAEAIDLLRNDVELAQKMAHIGFYILTTYFNWQDEAMKLVKLYNELS